MRISVSYIVRYRSREEMRLLNNHRKRTAQVILFYVLDIYSVVGDCTRLYLIESVHQIDYRSLSGTRRADKGYLLSRLCKE